MSSTTITPHQPFVPIDPVRWPDVARVPAATGRTPIAWALFRRAVVRLPIRVVTPDGELGGGGADAPVMYVHRPRELSRRLAVGGLIGFGESYLAGEWDADDLAALLTHFAARTRHLIPRRLQRLGRLVMPATPATARPTVEQAPANISHHYDLSNDLFATFLDETMTYSSAWFEPGDRVDAGGLAVAQRRKIDRLLDGCGVAAGSRVLEIGTGWGELAIRAATRGADVVTITLSNEQLALARRRAHEAGVADRVDVRLQDYRAVTGHFDAVVSVEMIEAVGEPFWPEFVDVLDRRLATGGAIGLQAITMPHDRMRAARRTHTWILKYIFPGGLIPSYEAVAKLVTDRTALRIVDRARFGQDYADTLALWRERFEAQRHRVAALGFDEVFHRMWRFYLAYSEAGFRTGMLDVEQLIMRRAA